MGVADVIRRVSPNDGQPDELDNSGVVGGAYVRPRRWTDQAPTHAGLWAVRWRDRPDKREVLWVDEPKESSANLEWGNRAYFWPVEQGQVLPRSWTDESVHSPYVHYVEDDEPEGHGWGYWFVLGCVVGSAIGIMVMTLITFLLLRH